MDRPDTNFEKRMQIIKAAVKVFSRHGFHQAKVEEIAQEAGVGKGTIYEYFDSKQHLFEVMVREGLKFYTGQMGEIGSPGGLGFPSTFREKLQHIVLMHLHYFLEYRELAEVTMHDLTLVSEEMRQWMKEARREHILNLQKIIEESQDRGEVRRDLDPELAAVAVAGLLGSLCHYVVSGRDGIELDRLTKKVVQMVLKGVAN